MTLEERNKYLTKINNEVYDLFDFCLMMDDLTNYYLPTNTDFHEHYLELLKIAVETNDNNHRNNLERVINNIYMRDKQ